MTRDKLRMATAMAICVARHDEYNGWIDLDSVEKEQFLKEADAAIDTIFAALKEPTEEIYQAGFMYHDIEKTPSVYQGLWQAMLNASPLAPKGE